MVVTLGGAPTDGPAAEKLAELHAHLDSSGGNSPAAGSQIESGERNALQLFSSALFGRAPEDYLQRTSVARMIEVAREAYDFYRSYIASRAPSLVKVFTRTGAARPATIIMTAISDRPFIVDTLTELLHRRNLERYVHLHPILVEEEGRMTSLVYSEVELIEDPTVLRDLHGEIESTLAELILVTDDFGEMVARAKQCAGMVQSAASAGEVEAEERQEIADYLGWLIDGGFVLLGYREWAVSRSGADSMRLSVLPEENLGLFRSPNKQTVVQLLDADRDAAYISESNKLIHFSKVLMQSPVHRAARMDLVALKLPSKDSNTSRVACFIGLLTSKSLAQEPSSVPFIRRKLSKILELEGLMPNTHSYKEIVSIANSLPKSDLLQYPTERLRQEFRLVFSLQRRSEVRASFYLDPLKRSVLLNVVLPKNRFSESVRQKIQRYVERLLLAKEDSAEVHLSVSDYPLVIIRLLIPNPSFFDVNIEMAKLERKITELSLTWEDRLHASLVEHFDEQTADRLCAFYETAFPDSYKAGAGADESVFDVRMLESLSAEHPLEAAIEQVPGDSAEPLYRLRLYKRGESLTLSTILPLLENAGLNIVSETVTPVTAQQGVIAGIYDFYARPAEGGELNLDIAKDVLLPGLKFIMASKADNDQLNRLLLRPGLNCTAIAILRTLVRYLWQIKAAPSEHTIIEALVKNPSLAQLVVDLFYARFDPSRFANDAAGWEGRNTTLKELKENITRELKNVTHILHDRALRALVNVLEATVRTNFFRHPDEFRIALKIDCSAIVRMPSPRPMYEIFVSAPDFDGVHLRGGKVARGGLRWSDRNDDYRTEVLGLMKTQMTKNSIIIPVGAKGGFIVKNQPREHAQLLAWVKQCYQGFIRSLLEVTDNLVDGRVVQPPQTVIYDEDDPYLVVAADRGTATFSDVANAIAAEFKFWLGDAFASGGSAGYDHKKYGITARGAWECVCRHFREIGINVDDQEFTVIGIGDMSGDVFGNGLLQSQNAKLIAAFDHRHVFIDPDPDPKTSYAERERLFKLPHSSWADYDRTKISRGGGVFERAQKEIPLSEEAQRVLGFNQPVASGDELIRAILRAPADLLWNGGIGTYVKSSEEDNTFVNDRANDDVRVDARDLRARVVGEGGNLGFTQRARIEYSRIGGRINMDAVDNSGGVDLSDYEVNLKILLSQPVRRGELSIEERNELLLSCAEEACEKIISRNRSQSLVLSLAVRRSRKNISFYRGLIQSLVAEGLLDREKEYLPDDETLNKRSELKAGLTRPELAVLVAYTKMSLYNSLIKSDLPDQPFFHQYLYNYFPPSIAERFGPDLLTHPLRREIIATQIANTIVEHMGASFVYRYGEEIGAPRTSIILAFTAAEAITDAEKLIEELRVLDRAATSRLYLSVLLRVHNTIDNIARWLLEHRQKERSVQDAVELFKAPFARLIGETHGLITDLEQTRFQETCHQLITHGVPKSLALSIASLPYATAFLDIIEIAQETDAPLLSVANLYSHLAQALHIRQLLEQATEIETADRWESFAMRTIISELRRSIGILTKAVYLEEGAASSEAMSAFLNARKDTLDRYRNSIHEFNKRPVTLAALLVLSKQLTSLARRVE